MVECSHGQRRSGGASGGKHSTKLCTKHLRGKLIRASIVSMTGLTLHIYVVLRDRHAPTEMYLGHIQ